MRAPIFAGLLAACGGASVDPPTSTPVERAPLAAASTAATVEAPKDWMWELVGGAREVFWRWPGGACERWRVEPEGRPAAYVGTLAHPLDEAGTVELRFAYEGDAPPRLSSPRVVVGAAALPVACATNEAGAWYLDAASCAAGAAPPLAPIGCLSSLADAARPRLVRITSADARAELERATRSARAIWTADGCTRRVVRTARDATYANDEYLYPTRLTWTPTGAVLEEEATRNPDYHAPKGGETTAIGCCAIHRYRFLAFDAGVAELVRVPSRGEPPNAKTERWWIGQPPPPDVAKACAAR